MEMSDKNYKIIARGIMIFIYPLWVLTVIADSKNFEEVKEGIKIPFKKWKE